MRPSILQIPFPVYSMGKKPRAKNLKVNAATDLAAKNLEPTSKTPINGPKHHELKLVVTEKPLKSKNMYVRRSGRLQSVIKPAQNQEVEEIDLIESERDENEPHFEENVEDDYRDGPTTNQKSLDEKGDDVIKAVEVLKSKEGAQGNGSCESPSVSLIYKSLYLDSQKKIEALSSENHELARKLEIVLGKLEVYENINKSQTVMILNLEKAIEALVRPMSDVARFSSQSGGGDSGVAAGGVVPNGTSAKKRRQDQKSNKVV